MDIDLDDKERSVLRYLIQREISKTRNSRKNREARGIVYVPPPGKRHAADNKIDALVALHDKLLGPEPCV